MCALLIKRVSLQRLSKNVLLWKSFTYNSNRNEKRLLLFFSWCCLGFTLGNLSAQNEGKEFWFTDGLLGCQNMYSFPSSVLQGGTIVIRTTQKVQVWVQTYNSTYQPDLPYPIQGGYRSCSFKRAINPTDMYSTNYDNSWILSYPIFVIATEDETQLYLENGTVTLNQPTNRQSAAKKYYLCPLFHETSLKLCKSARPSTTTPSIRCRMSP